MGLWNYLHWVHRIWKARPISFGNASRKVYNFGVISCFLFFFNKFRISLQLKHGTLLCLSLQPELPANTNILYVDLMYAEIVGSSHNRSCLPGMLLNLKKPVVFKDNFGIRHRYTETPYVVVSNLYVWQCGMNTHCITTYDAFFHPWYFTYACYICATIKFALDVIFSLEVHLPSQNVIWDLSLDVTWLPLKWVFSYEICLIASLFIVFLGEG